MSLEGKLKFPHIEQAAKSTPDGWLPLQDVIIEWTAKIVVDLASVRYEGITFKKGDKECYLPWSEIEKRLGIEW